LRILLALLIGCGAAAEEKPPAFSHKVHAPLKFACTKCHTGAASADAARFPKAALCETCHAGKAVPVFPTARVYRVPASVIFSHAKHAAAKAECSTCHGDVAQFDRLKVEHPTSMKACVDCHKKGGATTVCAACHELGQ